MVAKMILCCLLRRFKVYFRSRSYRWLIMVGCFGTIIIFLYQILYGPDIIENSMKDDRIQKFNHLLQNNQSKKAEELRKLKRNRLMKLKNFNFISKRGDNFAGRIHKARSNPKSLLVTTIKQKSDSHVDADGYITHAFNVSASDLLSFDRSIPDTRPKPCSWQQYEYESFPLASVIICFHNEAWSTLLRTVHTVLYRTPARILQEIILVDDASTLPHLGSRLTEYILKLPNVHLYRSNERLGLVGARLFGADKSKGSVLVFLDSHVEVNVQWLEPLLQGIMQTPAQIVIPTIDIINANSLQYSPAPRGVHGAFDWQLRFVWKKFSEQAHENQQDEINHIMSPAMIGGIFAVDKIYFYDIGAYDEGMKIWGAENIEMSLRVWMCHGLVNIVPCSRVGHIFRGTIPYSFPERGGAAYTIYRNTARVSEVWMDKYKWIYYATQKYEYPADILSTLGKRKDLRSRLKCKDFQWYLENILPELVVPVRNSRFFGQIHNKNGCGCLDVSGRHSLICTECQGLQKSQTFTLTFEGQFQQSKMCLIVVQTQFLAWLPCKQTDSVWVHHKGQQIATQIKGESYCLDSVQESLSASNQRSFNVVLHRCSVQISQQWTFDHQLDTDTLSNFDSDS